VRDLDHVDVKIIIGKDRAPDRRNTDGSVTDAEGVDALRDNAVYNAMTAAGAIAERGLFKAGGTGKNLLHNVFAPDDE
jgi:hypothetical protein